jgi:lipid-A-disaccharide synthase
VPNARYVGHPFFDDLNLRSHDESFVERLLADDRPICALLPGSRSSEVKANFAMMIRAAEKIAARTGDVRFVVAGFKESQRETLERAARRSPTPIEVYVGKTPEIMRTARAAIAVSGSVSLELMHYKLPSVVLYKLGLLSRRVMVPLLKKCRYITLVNMLANREIFPEFLVDYDVSDELADLTIERLTDESVTREIHAELHDLVDRYGKPGASCRAAEAINSMIRGDRRASA